MKRARTARQPAIRNVRARTGRDGAIDYALKMQVAEQLGPVTDHIYRVIELVGTSEESIEDAICSAVGRAHQTLRNLRWFEVVRTSGHVAEGTVRHFQVTLKVGFTMDNVG